ncbi:MAG TPA: alpha/beta fold hydrolase [Candidatus Hydrogenedentes bacterium]|nr:alpha/beta fold hydrolase [Candidatus Hydrogenedentota bacterium]
MSAAFPVHVRALGPKDGAPLVLLHGFLGHGGNWEETAALLAPHGVRVLAPDLPGHGDTAFPDGLDWPGAVRLLDAALSEQAPPPWHLGGYSLGGRLALQWALDFPEHVLSLTLESCSPGIADGRERAERRAADDALAARLDQMDANGESRAAFLRAWYSLPLFSSLAERPALFQRVIRDRLAAWPNAPGAALRAFGRGVQPPLWDALPQVTASALLLTGEGDARHAETLREMASSMPDAAVELLPDCGHAAHLEAPAAFAEKVAAFVCRHRA